MVQLTVIIRWSCDHNKIRIFVSCFAIQCSSQIQFFFCKILFDIIILDRRFFAVQHFHFFRNDINGSNMVMLCQKCGDGKTDIACSGDRNMQRGRGGKLRLSGIYKDIFRIKAKHITKCFELWNQWIVILLFQTGKLRPVDPCFFCKLSLCQF